MRIIGTDIDAAMTSQLLKTDPDIGLDIFNQMPDVNRSIRIRQCRGDENLTRIGGGHRLIWLVRISSRFLAPGVYAGRATRVILVDRRRIDELARLVHNDVRNEEIE